MLSQSERLAVVESQQESHQREHELNDRVWTARLDAIDARLKGIERLLLEVRLPSPPEPPEPADPPRRLLQPRDVGVISGSAALTSFLWWLVDVLRGLVGG